MNKKENVVRINAPTKRTVMFDRILALSNNKHSLFNDAGRKAVSSTEEGQGACE